MRIVRLLAWSLASAGIALGVSAQMVQIPGTLVLLAAPQGFTVARTFRGLENVRGGSSITV